MTPSGQRLDMETGCSWCMHRVSTWWLGEAEQGGSLVFLAAWNFFAMEALKKPGGFSATTPGRSTFEPADPNNPSCSKSDSTSFSQPHLAGRLRALPKRHLLNVPLAELASLCGYLDFPQIGRSAHDLQCAGKGSGEYAHEQKSAVDHLRASIGDPEGKSRREVCHRRLS